MGIHTGEALFTEDGYTGIDVHRAARIGSAGHGGQILVSATAHAALTEVQTRDLGTHRLAGLPEPEHIYQLLAEGLPRDFPPLRNTIAMLGNAMRVVIADDSVLLREGVVRLLEESGFEVVAPVGHRGRPAASRRPCTSRTWRSSTSACRRPTPTKGLRAASEIRERYPETGVLVLSQYVEAGYAMELLAGERGRRRLPAQGPRLRPGGVRRRRRAASATAARRSTRRSSASSSAAGAQHDPLDELTPREREVLELMAEGRSNQAIAERMFVTLRAVEKHVTSIFTKLGLPASADDHRRVLAVLTYLRG